MKLRHLKSVSLLRATPNPWKIFMHEEKEEDEEEEEGGEKEERVGGRDSEDGGEGSVCTGETISSGYGGTRHERCIAAKDDGVHTTDETSTSSPRDLKDGRVSGRRGGCSRGFDIDLDSIGIQYIIYGDDNDGNSVDANGNEWRECKLYVSEIKWGTLNPEFAEISADKLPYAALYGYGFVRIVIEVVWFLSGNNANSGHAQVLIVRRIDLSALANDPKRRMRTNSVIANTKSDNNTKSDGINNDMYNTSSITSSQSHISDENVTSSKYSANHTSHRRQKSTKNVPNSNSSNDRENVDLHDASSSDIHNEYDDVLLLEMVDGKTYPVYDDVVSYKNNNEINSVPVNSETQNGTEENKRADVKQHGQNIYRGRTMSVDELVSSSKNLHQSIGADKERLSPQKSSSNGSTSGPGGVGPNGSVSELANGSMGKDISNQTKNDEKQPTTSKYHHSHQISYEDMSRSMSAMWAGGTMVENDDDDPGNDLTVPPNIKCGKVESSDRRSKSVDFDNISGNLGGDSDLGLGTYMKAEGTDRENGNIDYDNSLTESDTKSQNSSIFPASLEDLMSDASATISVRKRLRNMLRRRDNAASRIETILISSSHLFEVDETVYGSGKDFQRNLRKEAEAIREQLRKRKLVISTRRSKLEKRFQLLSGAMSILTHAKNRLFSAQELLEFGRNNEYSAAEGAEKSGVRMENIDAFENDPCNDRIQGIPRLLCLERRLRARRCYMVLELSKIFTVSARESLTTSLKRVGKNGDLASLLSICGVTLGRWGTANDGSGNSRRRFDKNECESFGAALGFVAHVVNMISMYYGVPLRYNLHHCASRSVVVDLAPPIRLAALQETSQQSAGFKLQDADLGNGRYFRRSTPFNKDQDSSSSQKKYTQFPPPRPINYPNVELPLHLENVNQNEFHAAVWLLNKDIEQLLGVCGEKSVGYKLHHTLENLQRLYCCIRNAPPQESERGSIFHIDDLSNSPHTTTTSSTTSTQLSTKTMIISPSFQQQTTNHKKEVLRLSMDEAAILDSLQRLRLMST